jgi:hypothetical protein
MEMNEKGVGLNQSLHRDHQGMWYALYATLVSAE